MAFSPLFIKPVHYRDKSPVFSSGKVHKNRRKGLETSVVIDLNIISKMKDVILGKTGYEESGLQYAVKEFNKSPLYLSPGFSFNEADRDYYEELYTSFELFLKKYCPTYIDAPNSLALPPPKESKRTFKELSTGERYMHSISYLSMLLIQIIMRNFRGYSPIQKFEKYVEYMVSKVAFLTVIEAEIARYCFFESNECKDIIFKKFCDKIHDNFLKKGNKKYILKNALNSASDIIYYRVVAIQSNEELDGVIQDTWLLTADEGLKYIAQSIYFIPSFDGCDHKAVRLVRNNFQRQSSYWRSCDDLFESYNFQRNFINFARFTSQECESKFKLITNCILSLENELVED